MLQCLNLYIRLISGQCSGPRRWIRCGVGLRVPHVGCLLLSRDESDAGNQFTSDKEKIPLHLLVLLMLLLNETKCHPAVRLQTK